MKLFRPHIPLEVRCRVALRQLGEMWPDRVIDEHRADYSVAPAHRKSHGKLLASLLLRLAALLACEVKDLRLDHDQPLAARPCFRNGLSRKPRYVPDANDPEHLLYRPHGPEFAGSHLIKTNVRGDHGQHPDRVLIKREKRRRKEAAQIKRGVRFGRKIKAAFPPGKASRFPKMAAQVKRFPLRSANRWPPKGSRRFNKRRSP